MDIAPGPGTNAGRRQLGFCIASRFRIGILSPIFLSTALGSVPSFSAEPASSTNTPSVSAVQAISSFRLEPGFKMELVAAEPMVSAPVAMAFDEDGRLFVAEMPRTGSRGEPAPSGRVRVLEDTDEHGAVRSSKIYAQDLAGASAIACYAGGVFVAAGSEVLYLKDTHHDGGADVRQVVLSGFGGTNSSSTAGRLNSFKWGLDNRIHGVTAGIGGIIAAANWPGDPVSLEHSDFSFNPRTLAVVRESGPAQSGLTFDDWGRRFVSDWTKPLRLALYDERYLERNPFQPQAPAMIDVVSPGLVVFTTTAPPAPLSGAPNRLTAATNGPTRAWLSHVCGPLIYRGSLFPSNYIGNAFIPDTEAHLVHRALLRDNGFGISAERPAEERTTEFLSSRDPGFRPLQVMDGPDGALYVLDGQDGQERGRIYRIVPAAFKRPKPPELGKARTFELVSALAAPDGWHRETAARLLFERHAPDATPLLGDMLTNSRSPLARVQALWALDGIAGLREPHLLRGLGDPDPRVREQAVWLAYRNITNGLTSELFWQQLTALAGDQALRVRYAVAFAVGNVRRLDKPIVLAAILRRDLANPWTQTAVLSSTVDGAGTLLRTLAADPAVRNDPAGLAFLSQLSIVVGVQGRLDEVVQSLLYVANSSLDAGPAMTLLAGLAEGLHRTRSSLGLLDPQNVLQPFYVQALAAAINALLPEQARIAALDLLSFSTYTFADTAELLLSFCNVPTLPRLQAAALNVFARYNEPQVVPTLLARWPALQPFARNQALAALLTHANHIPEVLDALATGKISTESLSSVQKNFLRTFREPALRERALKILGPMSLHRPQAIERYQNAVRLTGDPRPGRDLFTARCSDCHRLSGVGQALGPDLLANRARGKSSLLAAILQPNASIPRQYATSVVETKDGEYVVGILAEENPLTLRLLQPGGLQQVWPKLNVESSTLQDWSLMPDGLEEGLTTQDLANLLEYLMTTPR